MRTAMVEWEILELKNQWGGFPSLAFLLFQDRICSLSSPVQDKICYVSTKYNQDINKNKYKTEKKSKSKNQTPSKIFCLVK